MGLEWDRRPSIHNLRGSDSVRKAAAAATGRGIKPIDTTAVEGKAPDQSGPAGNMSANGAPQDFNLPTIPLSPLGLMSGWEPGTRAETQQTQQVTSVDRGEGEREDVDMTKVGDTAGTTKRRQVVSAPLMGPTGLGGSSQTAGVEEEMEASIVRMIDGVEDVNDVAARKMVNDGEDVVMADAGESDMDTYKKIDALMREIDSVNGDRKKTKHTSGPPSEMSTPANAETLAPSNVDDTGQPEAPSSAGSFFFRKTHRSLPSRKNKQKPTSRATIPTFSAPKNDRMDVDSTPPPPNIYLHQLSNDSQTQIGVDSYLSVSVSPLAAASYPNLPLYHTSDDPVAGSTSPLVPPSTLGSMFFRERKNSSPLSTAAMTATALSFSPIALRSLLPGGSRPESPADLSAPVLPPGFSPQPTPSSSMPLPGSSAVSAGDESTSTGASGSKPSSSGKKRPPSMPGLGKQIWSSLGGSKKSAEVGAEQGGEAAGGEGVEGEKRKEEGGGKRSWLRSRGKEREREKSKGGASRPASSGEGLMTEGGGEGEFGKFSFFSFTPFPVFSL